MQPKKDMYVLGIHDGHAAGVSLLKNGHVVAAINEERLTMIKNFAGVPVLSIAKVLEIAGIDPSDITRVAVASKIRVSRDPLEGKKTFLFHLHMAAAQLLHSKTYVRLAVEVLSRLKPRSDLLEALNMIGINAPIVYIDHHACHAASAYFRRPWSDKTLVFTLDGMGDGISSTVSIGQGNTMQRIAQTSFFDSPSDNVYSEITEYLGMKRCEHEYKVMGLAPYGDYTKTIDVFRPMIRLRPSNRLEFENTTGRYLAQLQPFYHTYLAGKRFDHVAAGVQRAFEELVTAWVREAVKRTHIHKIACGGGSFLNVKANMLIRKIPEVSDMFIYPAADDSGLAEGVAVMGYVNYCDEHKIRPQVPALEAIYFGAEYSNDYIRSFLKQKKLLSKAQKVDPEHIADMLARGSIIARFAGRDEWGPRALGNRSIMADPRNLSVVQRLNRAIKQRDYWMPFAPAILKEDQAKYVKNSHFAPYMVEAFDTKPETVDEIIATIHPADRTTRPMTVNDWNPGWQAIVREFKKITGVGAILNTSFNLHGYPLVGTLEQALWTFENSQLDGLLFEDYLLTKRL